MGIKGFAFTLGEVVGIMDGEVLRHQGRVISRCDSLRAQNLYCIRFTNAQGNVVDEWQYEVDLSSCPPASE